MNKFLIEFPLREKRLDEMIQNGLVYTHKYLNIKNKKNINKIYNKSSSHAKNKSKLIRSPS